MMNLPTVCVYLETTIMKVQNAFAKQASLDQDVTWVIFLEYSEVSSYKTKIYKTQHPFLLIRE